MNFNPTALQAITTGLIFSFEIHFAAELESLLRVPIVPRSMFTAYPTRDGNHKLLNDMKGGSVGQLARLSERCNTWSSIARKVVR